MGRGILDAASRFLNRGLHDDIGGLPDPADHFANPAGIRTLMANSA